MQMQRIWQRSSRPAWGKDEILDLILSTSLFGWANRLMHTLGEPVIE
jgi:alkylhydroperoxidase family enzyme